VQVRKLANHVVSMICFMQWHQATREIVIINKLENIKSRKFCSSKRTHLLFMDVNTAKSFLLFQIN